MALFRYKGRGQIQANGYVFRQNEVTEVPDGDAATLRKLRGGLGGARHPSFEEVG